MKSNDWRYMMRLEMIKLRNRAIGAVVLFTVMVIVLEGIYS